MRLFIATLIFGAAATVAQDPYKHPTTNDITRRTADLLQGILDDIYKGGLEHLEAKKSAYLCDLASKKGSVLGFVGGLEIESYWKNKLEEYLEKKCKPSTTEKKGSEEASSTSSKVRESPVITTSIRKPQQRLWQALREKRLQSQADPAAEVLERMRALRAY
ncbi:hypothetical protein AAL_03258 [Moelleriella libera RCEF 2490]|uniref:Uncharacterized protein n=1 Tax=Moelleriella libera RCEF 2490 TaxID=1081109 RepID=A0A166PSE6_9HYPO|nr:hypothetical protein AAL_03258 [Moelleriella libera RCEF 2490]